MLLARDIKIILAGLSLKCAPRPAALLDTLPAPPKYQACYDDGLACIAAVAHARIKRHAGEEGNFQHMGQRHPLRRADDHRARQRHRLRQRQLRIARAWRQIDNQVIELAPTDIDEELADPGSC